MIKQIWTGEWALSLGLRADVSSQYWCALDCLPTKRRRVYEGTDDGACTRIHSRGICRIVVEGRVVFSRVRRGIMLLRLDFRPSV